jgi:nicotinamidase-related amidase
MRRAAPREGFHDGSKALGMAGKKQALSRDVAFIRDETALLFVDLQRQFLIPGLEPAHPEMGADHYFYRRIREVVLPNTVRLVRAARASGIEVVYTIIESLTKDGRDRSLDHKLSNIHLPKGHPDARVIEDIAPAEDDIVLPKTSSGVFNSTNIDYVLRNLGVRSLIVSGCLTDQCVDMAVRDAADKGYLVNLPEDGCATYSAERHAAALRAFGGYCRVTDTNDAIARLEAMR